MKTGIGKTSFFLIESTRLVIYHDFPKYNREIARNYIKKGFTKKTSIATPKNIILLEDYRFFY